MASLTFHGGVGEIGGNRVLLEDRGHRLLVDFGLSFRHQDEYFHEFLNPRKVNGIGDWIAMGMAPDLRGVYRQDYRDQAGLPPEERAVDGVLVSHAHMDHVGLIPLLRPDVPLYLSEGARLLLDTIQTTGAQTTKDFLETFEEFQFYQNQKGGISKTTRRTHDPTPRPVVEGPELAEGETDVEIYPVDHSLPGARGYILETDAGTVAYTGDFRFHGRQSQLSKKFAERLGGVDVLVTEGTNMGQEDPDGETEIPEPNSEANVRDAVVDAIGREDGFVAVNYPVRDLDRLLSFWEAAKATGRRLLLTTKQAWMMRRFHGAGWEVPDVDDSHIGVYLPRKGYGLVARDDLDEEKRRMLRSEYAPWEREFLDHAHAVTAADVAAEPNAYLVYIDLFNMTELVDLDPEGGSYVYSKVEAFNDEMELDFERLQNWLTHFELDYVKAHASGHASRPELEHMIDEARPGTIIPVHTLNVKAFEERYRDRVIRAETGRSVAL